MTLHPPRPWLAARAGPGRPPLPAIGPPGTRLAGSASPFEIASRIELPRPASSVRVIASWVCFQWRYHPNDCPLLLTTRWGPTVRQRRFAPGLVPPLVALTAGRLSPRPGHPTVVRCRPRRTSPHLR